MWDSRVESCHNAIMVTIRTMSRAEVDLAIAWAAEEGWNPGIADPEAFWVADPGGFLIAVQDGAPLGCISAVRYGTDFGFIGLYIVRPQYRARGVGIALWRAAMERLVGRNIGLDGVLAQQAKYRRSGFALAHRNIRFGLAGGDRPPTVPGVALVPASAFPIEALFALDRWCFPAPREAFIRHWLAMPGHLAVAAQMDGAPVGYGVIRPCLEGAKVGPLVARDDRVAAALLAGLVADAPSGPVFLDVPEPNDAALALARDVGMTPVFETARMYTGCTPDLLLSNVFGITTFELG
jgi:GNAT superfamily N-acetyltransferase